MLERPAEMAIAYAELTRQVSDGPAIEPTRADSLGRQLREPRHHVRVGAPRRELGAAPEAGPVSSPLGGGGRLEETPVTVLRQSRRADRAAIDPRGRDRDKEHPVEARVAGVDRAGVRLAMNRRVGLRWKRVRNHDDTGGGEKREPLATVIVKVVGKTNQAARPVQSTATRHFRTLNSYLNYLRCWVLSAKVLSARVLEC